MADGYRSRALLSVSTSFGRQEADDRECYPASTLLSRGTAGMAALGPLPPPLALPSRRVGAYEVA